MNALEEAIELCGREELGKIIEFCASYGIVHSEKDFFICAYPTHSSLIGQNPNKRVDKPNCWFVFIAVGDMQKAFSLGKKYRYVAYERFDGKYRIMEYDRLRRHYGKQS